MRKNRRGTSLVELLLVMSACTVVLTLSAELIHRVMIVQTKATAFFNAERSAQRLAAAFRSDVHAATNRQADEDEEQDDGRLLTLSLPKDQFVEYRSEQGTITRTLREGEAVLAREQFVFPPEATVLIADGNAGMITLTIDSPIDAPSPEDPRPLSQAFATPVKVQLQAILGRNARIASLVRSQEESP